MHVLDIGQFAGRGAVPHGSLADLISRIGRPDFGKSLLALSRLAVGADHVTAFAEAPGDRIGTVVAENGGPRPLARTVAERYVRHHWQSDPVTRLLRGPEGRRIIVDIDADDVEKGDYRRDCYAAVSLGHRLSVAESRGARTMRLNFYRARGEDFRPEDVERLGGMAEMLLAMLWRHEETAAADENPEALFNARLASLAPGLSVRERQVCALIALGVTSEGIGLRLDIGLNTVLTYRKRAYARLGISSQNELMRRLMS
ncbi:helix-turn-helix transcriptional regulator [Phreatobacter cathodiphilus]|nr:helix-turn-helix transcriptional regulator [Phreatobacter cathodiphilus]